ncbi:MAG: PKD domain-containing protein [Actinobacteria bacterium]|nr:PKD domain-containing protein [Actinomycetota bacterium]
MPGGALRRGSPYARDWEGPERTPGYKDLPGCAGVGHTAPAYSYSRSEGVSVTGGVFYDGDLWPERYRGAYLFGDYGSERLWTAQIDTDGRIASAPIPFGSGIGGPVHFRTAPNGDVMYADIYSGNVVRLSYAPGNRRPTPLVTTRTDPATRTVEFDASASSDLDGDARGWSWDFGDPGSTTNTATGAVVSHTYSPGETFTARLTLTDGIGEPVVHDVVVWPGNHEPVLSVVEGTGTGPDGTFTVGDPVQLSATATDAEDGALEVTWTSALVHCRGTSCHDHEPMTMAGPSFSTVFDDHGGDTRLVVRATATDSTGTTTTHQFAARPSLRRLSVQTNTPVLVTINGVDGLDAIVTEGSTNSVTLPPNATDGVASFSAWGDGVTGRSRQVVVGAGDVSLSAPYATPIERRYADEPALRRMIGAPLGPEQGSADLRWRDYDRGRIYWTPTTGAHVLIGAIRATFLRLGGHVTQGVPLNDERTTPDGIGRYVHFSTGVSIYWTPQTGAHAVGGAIRQRWQALGWERGPMGYPTTDELPTPDGIVRFNHFSKGSSIYWTPWTGAHGVWGAIRQRWGGSAMGARPDGLPREQ